MELLVTKLWKQLLVRILYVMGDQPNNGKVCPPVTVLHNAVNVGSFIHDQNTIYGGSNLWKTWSKYSLQLYIRLSFDFQQYNNAGPTSPISMNWYTRAFN